MADWHGDDIDAESIVEPEEGADDAAAKVKKLKAEIETLKKEKQEYLDGWQRSKADYVNLLKRTEVDAKGHKDRGVEKAIEALLPAFDALERAKAHGEVPEGFIAIAKQLESAFAGLGLEALGQVGEKFDPAIHEAYAQETTAEESKDDSIVAILEPGYKLGEKVLRPAKVKVARFQ